MKTRKGECRVLVRERLQAISMEEREEKSAKICEHIAALEAWKKAGCAGLFAGMRREPDLRELCDGRVRCGFPRVEGDALRFYEVDKMDALLAGAFGVREPGAGARLIEVSALDVLLVPGLAFDKAGMRLGRGGGFYDRLLSMPELRALLVGVCFDVQVIEDVPVEPHDCGVDVVVTESGCVFGS